jgi:type 1 glutamine amidotransferase
VRVLVLCDDYWHPASVAREGLNALQGRGEFEFDWIEDAGEWSSERMDGYPAVVFAKSNNVSAADRTEWMTPEAEQAFLEYVQAGNGLLVVHSGSAGYKETPVFRALMGGVFDHHPKQCPVTVWPKAGHPLVEGSEAFTVQDEHYHMLLDDAGAEVFLTASSEHGPQPGGWTRIEGVGRVCMLTPGHNVQVWLHPSYQVLLGNALRWCAAAG